MFATNEEWEKLNVCLQLQEVYNVKRDYIHFYNIVTLHTIIRRRAVELSQLFVILSV